MATLSTAPNGDLDIVTLGMFIIDQIHFHPSANKLPLDDIPGGAGTYAILGARLFSPAVDGLARRCGWIVDAGVDFPEDVRDVVHGWGMRSVVRVDEGRKTTRGWNSYVDGERAFRYLTPKLRLEPKDLLSTGLYPFKSIHLICSPSRLRHILDELPTLFPQQCPLIVYEPVPDCCTLDTLPELMELLPRIDVLSPNAGELLSFFGQSLRNIDEDEGKEPSDTISKEHKSIIENLALKLSEKSGGMTNVIIRCGALGSYHISSSGSSKLDLKYGIWLPAYHASQDNVVDPTGAGNAFCGAVGVALTRGLNIDDAVCWGNVAAGFVVEQTGLPVLNSVKSAEERWNGEVVMERLKVYRARALRSSDIAALEV